MSRWQKWGPFILRIVLGSIFIYEGSVKFSNMLGWFGGNPWPFLNMVATINFLFVFQPSIWAILATLGELLGGLMIFVGFRTRTAALLLVTIMVVAILGWHLPQGDAIRTMEKPIAMMGMALSLIFSGPGRYHLKLKKA